ncbi:MAG: SigE family RNA polymerase sigma factor, partial [Streptomycetaceae bacterium]|nr:SigE family RNA polymerase sigma factor [Streptomycetaceae bacterium]
MQTQIDRHDNRRNVVALAAVPSAGTAASRAAVPDTGCVDDDFTAYVRERRSALFATAYHLTGDRNEAEDLLQSALMSTYQAWGRIQDKAALGGYLRRTMT